MTTGGPERAARLLWRWRVRHRRALAQIARVGGPLRVATVCAVVVVVAWEWFAAPDPGDLDALVERLTTASEMSVGLTIAGAVWTIVLGMTAAVLIAMGEMRSGHVPVVEALLAGTTPPLLWTWLVGSGGWIAVVLATAITVYLVPWFALPRDPVGRGRTRCAPGPAQDVQPVLQAGRA